MNRKYPVLLVEYDEEKQVYHVSYGENHKLLLTEQELSDHNLSNTAIFTKSCIRIERRSRGLI